MEQCSICLESLDGGVVALACGHRFHAACLAQMAGAVGTATTRRGSLTACPNCRTVSRVDTSTPVAFSVGDRVLALWGHEFYPGVVDEVVDSGRAYEIKWDDGDEGRVLAKNVRAEAPAPARSSPRRAPPAPVRAPPRRPAVASAAPAAAPTRRRLMRCGNCKACRGSHGRPCRAPVPFVPSKKSRFTGVELCPGKKGRDGKWRAKIQVRGSEVNLGTFDDEEDAARAYDAARVKYRDAYDATRGGPLNFPGEAPLASVLAALPELDDDDDATATNEDAPRRWPPTKSGYDAIVAAAASATAVPRHERSVAARRVVPPAPVPQKRSAPRPPKPVEMRRVGDAEWRWFGSQTDAAKAFDLDLIQVSLLVRDPSKVSEYVREGFEARPACAPKKRKRPAKKKPRFVQRKVEGATSKVNGKWVDHAKFPGREFDDLDEYRVAKKQRAAQRKEYSARRRENPKGHYY